MDRRSFLRAAGLLVLSSWSWARLVRTRWRALGIEPLVGTYPYELPPLPYAYEALEPAIDAQTMRIHHQAHHGGYVKKLNEALAELPSFQSYPLEELLANLPKIPEAQRMTIRNNGGGHWNHSFFWRILTPKLQEPSSDLQKQLAAAFGSWVNFRASFLDAAAKVFGSGWAWLIKTDKGLEITVTPNQDNPLMPTAPRQGKPILGIDVWEHAYYLRYQNRRTEYLAAVWNLFNWQEVEALLG